MCRIRLFLAAIFFNLLTPLLPAQITDNFSDGNFNQNPVWTGDAGNFKISAAGELQLNATAAGQSALWVNGNMPDSTIWEFDIRLAFDPSGSNLARVFLQLDQPDPAIANGYFIEMGESGSADAIRFFRQDAGAKTLIATGQAGLAASNPNLHIRAQRNAAGDWTLEAATVGSALQTQFAFNDAAWPGGDQRFFGFQCVYTISNATKFYFDNINIRPDVPDVQPPVLVSALADNATQVTLLFDEDLETASAENPANYTINNGVGQPADALLGADLRTVTLTLGNALNSGVYTVLATGIQDLAGNETLSQSLNFTFIRLSEFDVIINEIMSNPNPPAGLPLAEWLELFNRSTQTIDLSKLRLSDATGSPVELPAYQLSPGGYVTLAANANVSILQNAVSGDVLGIPVGVSLLNNDEDLLTITDASGNVIERVFYNSIWHTDAGKRNGGYSLERINPDLPCLGGENWQSTPSQIGGTPGKQNDAFASGADTDPPWLFNAWPESDTEILLTFSEGMDRASVENIAAYQFDPPIPILSAVQQSDYRAQVRLTLAMPMERFVFYTLNINNSVRDCSDNAYFLIDTVIVGVAEAPEAQDIVINEILFNPATGGARYVEFYNRSEKIFDWSEFFIASNSETATDQEQIVHQRLFLPGDYHVFSSNAQIIRDSFNNIVKRDVMQNPLPSLDDLADSLKLYWVRGSQSATIDDFYYYRGLHNALLSTSEQEGVAIERLRADEPTQSSSNWTSASSLITGAYGTPTLPNSQSRNGVTPAESDELISIPLARLSPDGDNREDFLEIFYRLPREGYVASMSIFDADGNMVKQVVRQTLVGIEGVVRWDGETENGGKTRPGIHIIYVEVFSPDGDVQRIKKAVAVVGKY
jgi:hypothetical protein